jgi:hypothetical protein
MIVGLLLLIPVFIVRWGTALGAVRPRREIVRR